MLLLSVRLVLGGLFLLQAAPQPKHTWIADLKANRATLGNSIVRVEGDVVDIRSTSPTAKFGFYRLIDASDPAGLLVRTNQLPKEGGALAIRAKLASQQPSDGSLLLDEIDRQRTDKKSNFALILVAASLFSVVALAGLLLKAAIEERRYKVSPPLWLLPDAGPYGKAGAATAAPAPALKYSADLEEQDRQQRQRLTERTRGLFKLTLGAIGLTAASGAWLLLSKPASAQMPAFIFIEADDVPIPAAPAPPPSGDTTLAQLPPQRVDSTPHEPQPRRRDSVATRKPTTAAPAPAPTKVDTVRIVEPAPAPAPAPAPSPPPPPPASPEPSPPPLDPAVERTRAAAVSSQAAQSLVDAINSHRLTDVAVLLPEGIAGDLGRRERFMKLLKDFSPRATLGSVEGTSLAEGRAETRFAVSFSWRGDFGVERKKTARFLGLVTRDTPGWRFEGARLLDAIP